MGGRGRTGWLAAALVAALVVAGCSSSGDDAVDAAATTSTTATGDGGDTFAVQVDSLERDGDGWAVPDPLPAGEPGDVIAAGETAPSDVFDGALRTDLLYHSTSRTGDDVAVSGTLLVPDGEAPDGGWPVISWGHGTSGVADVCAPSTSPNLFYNEYAQQVQWFLDAGYAVAATDYVGLGTPGMHSYSVGEDLGNAVADIVPAARSIDADLGTTWYGVGHSEGGQAVLFATRAAARHPDLELGATVAIAPSSNLQLALPVIAGGTLPRDVVYAVYFLAGASTVDPSIDPAELVGPAAVPHLDLLLRDGCLVEGLDALGGSSMDELFAIPDEDMRRISALLGEVGNPDQEPTVGPVLIVQGEDDQDVPPIATDALVASLQDQGADVTYRTVPDEDHDTVLGPTVCETLDWLAEHGGPTPTDCEPAPTDMS